MEVSSATSSAATGPQINFFENFPGHRGVEFGGYSNGTLSFHAVNIPLSLSLGYPVVLISLTTSSKTATSKNHTLQFGLYSLNGSTLSLANSASKNFTLAASNGGISWISLITSATQNITPGAWYFAFNIRTGGHSALSIYNNSSINPANNVPGGFLMGRVTVSQSVMPGSIATSSLDITGLDAMRQPYIIITA